MVHRSAAKRKYRGRVLKKACERASRIPILPVAFAQRIQPDETPKERLKRFTALHACSRTILKSLKMLLQS